MNRSIGLGWIKGYYAGYSTGGQVIFYMEWWSIDGEFHWDPLGGVDPFTNHEFELVYAGGFNWTLKIDGDIVGEYTVDHTEGSAGVQAESACDANPLDGVFWKLEYKYGGQWSAWSAIYRPEPDYPYSSMNITNQILFTDGPYNPLE